jgi:hypothetical protein
MAPYEKGSTALSGAVSFDPDFERIFGLVRESVPNPNIHHRKWIRVLKGGRDEKQGVKQRDRQMVEETGQGANPERRKSRSNTLHSGDRDDERRTDLSRY